MKKILIGIGVLSAIISSGSIVHATITSPKTTGYYDMRVDGYGGSRYTNTVKKVSNTAYGTGKNSSITKANGLGTVGTYYSAIYNGSSEITYVDSFSSGGSTRMDYRVSGASYNGFNLRMRISSRGTSTVDAYVKGEWNPM